MSARFLVNWSMVMRKKLIAAIVAALILLAAAVGVVIYMETKGAAEPGFTVPSGTTADVTEAVPETTEETVGMTFPTENPDDVTPDDAFTDEDIVPPVTGDAGTGETEDRESNETPEDVF